MNLKLLNVFLPLYLQKALVILALISFPLSLYNGFVYERQPILRVGIQQILPLDSKNSNSRALVWIKVENIGNSDLLPSMYDPSAPVRIILDGIKIESPPLLNGNNTETEPQGLEFSERAIQLPSKLIRHGDIFTIRAFATLTDRSHPKLSIIGQIAGKMIIDHRGDDPNPLELLLFDQKNDIFIYFLRWFIYSIPVAFVSLLFYYPYVFISRDIKSKIKNKYIGEFKRSHSEKLIGEHEAIFDLYQRKGIEPLTNILALIANGEHFLNLVNSELMFSPYILSNQAPIGIEISEGYPYHHLSIHEIVTLAHFLMFIRFLKRDSDGQWKFWKPMYTVFLEFCEFLFEKSKKYQKISRPTEPDFVSNDV